MPAAGTGNRPGFHPTPWGSAVPLQSCERLGAYNQMLKGAVHQVTHDRGSLSRSVIMRCHDARSRCIMRSKGEGDGPSGEKSGNLPLQS